LEKLNRKMRDRTDGGGGRRGGGGVKEGTGSEFTTSQFDKCRKKGDFLVTSKKLNKKEL